MHIFNYIGMLLLAYSSLFCASKSASAYLSYQHLSQTPQPKDNEGFEHLSNAWLSMASWLFLGLVCFVLVFKLAPL